MACVVEVLALAAVLGLLPAAIASAKGYSFWLWWFYGWMLFIVALPHSLLLPNRRNRVLGAPYQAQPAPLSRRGPAGGPPDLGSAGQPPDRSLDASTGGTGYRSELAEAFRPGAGEPPLAACPSCGEQIRADTELCPFCGWVRANP